MIDLNKYIGLPYEDLNCWQLFCKIQQEKFHLEMPEIEMPHDMKGILRLLRDHPERYRWVLRPDDEYYDGNAVLMRRQNMDRASHIGVWVNGGVLHTTERTGCLWQELELLPVLELRLTGVYERLC